MSQRVSKSSMMRNSRRSNEQDSALRLGSRTWVPRISRKMYNNRSSGRKRKSQDSKDSNKTLASKDQDKVTLRNPKNNSEAKTLVRLTSREERMPWVAHRLIEPCPRTSPSKRLSHKASHNSRAASNSKVKIWNKASTRSKLTNCSWKTRKETMPLIKKTRPNSSRKIKVRACLSA